MFLIKWTNKYSQETGYVGGSSTKKRCFYNADRSGAKIYASEKAAKRTIEMLKGFGEAENNDFEIVCI